MESPPKVSSEQALRKDHSSWASHLIPDKSRTEKKSPTFQRYDSNHGKLRLESSYKSQIRMLSIEISSGSNFRILKEGSKRCQSVDDKRNIDPAAGRVKSITLSTSVSDSTFSRMLRDHPIKFNGTQASECTLAALPENPVAPGRYYLPRKQRIIRELSFCKGWWLLQGRKRASSLTSRKMLKREFSQFC